MNSNKRLLTTDELIAKMVDDGISFNEISINDAKHFLEEHNYYFKIAAYRANYNKKNRGVNSGKYINLDFAYLKELAVIDCRLRYLILKMCLDLEHALKLLLLKDIENNSSEDGYNIVKSLYCGNKFINKLKRKKESSYSQSLIEKYSEEYPIWVVCEMIPFGDFCKLIEKYDSIYPKRLGFDCSLLFFIRDLRNAVAHNNCLIHNFKYKYDFFTPNAMISKSIAEIKSIGKTTRTKNLNYKPLHDFVTLLYLYPIIVKSEHMKRHVLGDLKKILYKRMTRNRNYFTSNHNITSVFAFIFKVFNVLKMNYIDRAI